MARTRSLDGRYASYTKEQSVASFWAAVDVKGPNECWPWKGYCLPNGYGYLTFRGTHHTAHQVAFCLSGGVLEPNQEACHTCDNRPCCNPSHLFAGTRKDNIQDAINKGRFDKKGSRNMAHKLTEEIVAQMRRDYSSGMSQPALARKYNVTRQNVNCIITGKTWKHVH